MRKLILAPLVIIAAMSFTINMKNLHDFSTKTLDGKDFSFSSLKGKK